MRTTLNINDELLAKAAELTGVPLWTLDKRLNEAAKRLGAAP
jgi:predicted nucleic acid-binding protein